MNLTGNLSYLLSYYMGNFPSKLQKNLDPSCMIVLDFWGCFRREKETLAAGLDKTKSDIYGDTLEGGTFHLTA